MGLTILGLIVIGGCLGTSASPFPVELAAAAVIQDGAARIAGITNLPDGAIVGWTFQGASSQASGTATCSGGAFAVERSVTTWKPGEVVVTVVFDPSQSAQPSALRKACGDKGKRMTGPTVIQQGDKAVAKLTLTFVIPEPPPPPPTQTTTSGTTISPGSITVYITNTGTKYHLSGCRHLSASKIAISLADAKARGYTACGVCKPPN
jgi:hypothetical protein